RSVIRLHATAVLNRKLAGPFLAELFGNLLTNEGMNLLSLFRRRITARTDGPDRLLSNHQIGKQVAGCSGKATLELGQQYCLGSIRLAFFQGFAHAQDRLESRVNGREHLAIDECVAFTKLMATLAVTEDDVFAARVN